jgi:hypothetical protein
MPGMPRFLGKGAVQSGLDRALRDPMSRATALVRLRDWERADPGGRGSLASVFSGGLTEDQITHLAVDWFGTPETPFWVGTDLTGGEVEQLCAQLMKEALEVSLGLSTDESVLPFVQALCDTADLPLEVGLKGLVTEAGSARDAGALPAQQPLRRDLPLDIYWICELPELEGYVSWNEQQVTVIVATPPIDADVFVVHSERRRLAAAKESSAAGLIAVQRAAQDGIGRAGEIVTALYEDRDYSRWDS